MSQTLDGVINIELIPEPNQHGYYLQQLRKVVKKAVCLRRAIAYWTVEPNFVSDNLPKLLSSTNSFICVDINLPTDINKLSQLYYKINFFVNKKASIYLHLHKITQDTEHGSNAHMPLSLMHTKMLLFDMPDDKAELWVGSHNWTRRALKGINIETSLRLEILKESPIYNQAKIILEQIREYCEIFDINKIDDYQNLQGIDKSKRVISVKEGDVQCLKGTKITVLTSNVKKINFLTINSAIYLSVLDKFAKEKIYHGSVITISIEKEEADILIARIGDSRQFILDDGNNQDLILQNINKEYLHNIISHCPYFFTLEINEPVNVKFSDVPKPRIEWCEVKIVQDNNEEDNDYYRLESLFWDRLKQLVRTDSSFSDKPITLHIPNQSITSDNETEPDLITRKNIHRKTKKKPVNSHIQGDFVLYLE